MHTVFLNYEDDIKEKEQYNNHTDVFLMKVEFQRIINLNYTQKEKESSLYGKKKTKSIRWKSASKICRFFINYYFLYS